MGSAKTPKVQDPAKSYLEGIQTNLRYAPAVANEEYKLRGQYDNTGVEQTLDRQKALAPGAADLYRNELAQISPWSQKVRSDAASAVENDLVNSYSLNSDQARQAQQTARTTQVTSGNILGNAAVSKEATVFGAQSFTAHQQRLQNAGSFISHNNALQQLTTTSLLTRGATAPDRSSTYVNSNTGTSSQNSLEGYYNQAAQYAANYNPLDHLSPWQRMAQGAVIGARQGWSGGSIVSPVIGAWGALGGALGGSFQGFINAPDYQWNVQNSGYAIYGTPVSSTFISLGVQAGSYSINTGINGG